MSFERLENGFYKTVGLLYLIFISVYFSLEIVRGFVSINDWQKGIIVVAIGAIALIASVFIYFSKKLSNRVLSLVNPAILMLAAVAAAAVSGDYSRIYLVFVSASVFSVIYLEYKSAFLFFLISQTVTLLMLFALRLPLGGIFPEYFAYSVAVLVLTVSCVSLAFIRSVNEKARNMLKLIMLMTPNFMVITDENSRISYLSDSVVKVFGLSEGSLCAGRPVSDIFSNDLLKKTVNEIVESEGYVERTIEFELNGGKKYFFFKSINLPGSKIARLFDFSDITDIMDSKVKAEKALQSKSDFLASMSHEVRTPMNAIIGMSDLLSLTELTPAQRGYAENIKNASNSLLSIINDILDFSKMDSHSLKLSEQNFCFESFLNETINIINLRGMNKDIEFTVLVSKNIPMMLYGDDLRLKQALVNVLDNAVEYTESGAVSFEVSADIMPGKSVNLKFAVKDTGIGMREVEIGRLFSENETYSGESEGYSGAGLGLSMSKSLIQLLGGTLTAESEYERGSTFRVNVMCGYVTSEMIVKTELIGKVYILIYEPNSYSAEVMENMCLDLGVPHKLCSERLNLHSILTYQRELPVRDRFTHFYADSSIPGELMKLAGELGLKAVLMKRLGEQYDTAIHAGLSTIQKPVTIMKFASALENTVGAMGDIDQIKLLASSVPFTTNGAHILVVGDNKINLAVCRGLLTLYGIQVFEAGNGYEAISRLSCESFDMVFMDCLMLELDGIECARIIRRMGEQFESLPIIALTSESVMNKEKLSGSEVDEVLMKPLLITALNQVLLKYLPEGKIIHKPSE